MFETRGTASALPPGPIRRVPSSRRAILPRIMKTERAALNRRLLWLSTLLLVCLPGGRAHATDDDVLARVLARPSASLALAENGHLRIAHQVDRPMIPASTMKLVTALAALERWGRDRRFATAFYRTAEAWLWVVGSGDPYLTSEELAQIATALAARGVAPLAGVGLDDRWFAADDALPGRTTSTNPYDAPVTALAANFNTVNVRVGAAGIASAEPQTPLTATARRLARDLPPGTHRVNVATREQALTHFGELLVAQLRGAGIDTPERVRIAPLPDTATLVYRHENGRDLGSVLAALLKYSNNFVANSLFLALGEREDVARVAQAQQFMDTWARARFGWRDFHIDDGAGLSRDNRLSARQLIDVLRALAPYRDLLPAQDNDPRVRAKTGTLSGVSAYAGYVRRDPAWQPFALLIEGPVAPDWRARIASALAALPRGERAP